MHPRELREPVPLSLHHLPLPITFAAFEGGELLAVDPSLKEEAAAAGSFTGAHRCCLLACMECVCMCVAAMPNTLVHKSWWSQPNQTKLCLKCAQGLTRTHAVLIKSGAAGLLHPCCTPCRAVVQNAFGELCALQKIDGCGLTPPQLLRCIRLATQKVRIVLLLLLPLHLPVQPTFVPFR